MKVKKRIVKTPDAPGAIGPYSQAVIYDGMVYCSGQIPLHPVSMEIIPGGVREQAEQVMKNLEQVLLAAGSDFSRVLKSTIYLTDMSDFPVVNEVYGARFSDNPPARETVAVKTLPKEVLVEISCIAHL